MDLGITLDFGHDATRLDHHFAALGLLVDRAGELGYAMLSTGEQHPGDANYFHLPAPLAALAAFAGRITSSATPMALGTGVLLLPTWDPLRLAYEAAMLDQLCGGRLVLGVGAGNPPTWARFGVSKERLPDRLDQTIRALKAVWSGHEYHGDLVSVSGPVLPAPVQPGGPPVIVGGVAPRALRRAATLADGWIAGTSHRLDADIVPAIGRYHELCDAAGRPRGQVLANRLAVVADELRELAAAAGPVLDLLRLYTRLSPAQHPDGSPVTPDDVRLGTPLVDQVAIVGTPEQARAQLARYAEAGVTRMQLRIQPAGLSADAARRTIELLAP